MPTPLANDLIDDALACPCDETPGPLCTRCECLLALVQVIDLWECEQRTGMPWAQVVAQILAQGAA